VDNSTVVGNLDLRPHELPKPCEAVGAGHEEEEWDEQVGQVRADSTN
jgi:hypothetical protein